MANRRIYKRQTIYKNKTFHVYAEHAVRIKSYYSDDNISQSKKPEWNNDNGCNVKANEYKQLEETLDANDKLFAYIGYSFTGTEMEVKFDQYKFNVAYDLNGGQEPIQHRKASLTAPRQV